MSAPNYALKKEDTLLMMELYRRVNTEILSLPKNRVNQLKIKLFILLFFYLSLYLLALFFSASAFSFFLFYGIMGITAVLMFSNFIHEAAHGNLFTRSGHNRLVYYIFDLLGANSYIWQKRHLLFHHKYPNIMDWDADVEQSGPVNVFPHQKTQKYQRYQKYYVFLLYPLFLLNWIFVRDFRDFFFKKRVVRKLLKIPLIEYPKMIIFKVLYLIMMIGLPVFIGRVSFAFTLVSFVWLTVCGSLLGMIILLTPHINIDNEFATPNSSGNMENSWFRHQFLSTNDIHLNNRLARQIMGNFNFHVCHHLFPGISSVYAPEVTEVIKNFAREHKLPYRSLNLKEALVKHYRLIQNNTVNIIEEIELEP